MLLTCFLFYIEATSSSPCTAGTLRSESTETTRKRMLILFINIFSLKRIVLTEAVSSPTSLEAFKHGYPSKF